MSDAMADRTDPHLILAAQRGDQQALDALIASYLPLVYNIVGRALQGHADVDDVVQETMLRVVNGLAGLRDPAAFRSWLVSIAIHEVRDSRSRGRRRPVGDGGLEELQGVADPGADFVDLTILRLGLSDQRRETAEATRWLDEADRDLLALWWLEAAGQITRGELAAALEETPAYAAVRVQRMKAQLETARTVVRAVWATPRCAGLDAAIRDWDGRPSPLWRKRLGRHVRECGECSAYQRGLVSAESLLAGVALVPVPLTGAYLAGQAWLTPSRRRPNAGRSFLPTSKLVIASAAVAVLGVSAAIAMAGSGSSASPNAGQVADGSTVGLVTGTSAASSTSTQAASSTSSATSIPSPTSSHSSATPPSSPRLPTLTSTAPPVYGHTVDTADAAPNRLAKPGPLPRRPETAPITATGNYSQPFKGSLGGKYLMFWNGQNVTVTGTGYFYVRYEIAWFNRVGPMVMPTWTGLQGKLFHVASGGGRRMDDNGPGQPSDVTWMGNPKAGYITLPPGAQQMWNNEFFYLDGTVTLHETEGYADYNLSVTPYTWEQVTHDIGAAPDGHGIVRYGLVRDTGTDAAPVPQYLTRSTPAKPTDVPQHSAVTAGS
ncbi:sigma-70 family RNA polymerase sigma factor [Catenulispora rubra]|uniref:sigma-70 family RNA polymerase sigma factor n=1 Tax=Catenulispora rubra TaxID=280293 RepID=UPI001E59EB69|nr:sigma-70 family RNA polymerase sigma factor [Catenulispora rubra]